MVNPSRWTDCKTHDLHRDFQQVLLEAGIRAGKHPDNDKDQKTWRWLLAHSY